MFLSGPAGQMTQCVGIYEAQKVTNSTSRPQVFTLWNASLMLSVLTKLSGFAVITWSPKNITAIPFNKLPADSSQVSQPELPHLSNLLNPQRSYTQETKRRIVKFNVKKNSPGSSSAQFGASNLIICKAGWSVSSCFELTKVKSPKVTAL